MQSYSAITNEGILPFGTTYMDLEGIMLSKISQTEKDKYNMISLICGILKNKKVKLIETEYRMMVAMAYREE